eukprot:COSAG06_NODE_34265_length_477_cov_0.822751_1_plen_43_part_10
MGGGFDTAGLSTMRLSVSWPRTAVHFRAPIWQGCRWSSLYPLL